MQPMPPNYPDLVKFCMKQGKNKVFINKTETQIAQELQAYAESGKALFSFDYDYGHFRGIVIYDPVYRARILYIRQLLCTSKKALGEFLKAFQTNYPGWTIQARRRQKCKSYGDKTDRLITLLSKKTL